MELHVIAGRHRKSAIHNRRDYDRAERRDQDASRDCTFFRAIGLIYAALSPAQLARAPGTIWNYAIHHHWMLLVLAAGLPQDQLSQRMAGDSTTEIASYPAAIVTAATAALHEAYCHAIFVVAMVSMTFGIIGLIASACCKDVDHKMTDQIDVYLENDRLAGSNKHH